MRLNPIDLETIRTRPQSTSLRLFIFNPQKVFEAKIADSEIGKGARKIYVDYISPTGTSIVVEPDTTLLVGTKPSLDDVGRIRIREASFYGTSGSISVSENSHIMWRDGLYVTGLKYWEINPIYPRIIQNPSNPEDVIFYKDYDIPYTNQNSKFGSVIHMGSHRARVLDGLGQASIYWSATGTFNVGGDEIVSYLWQFEGGTPSGSVLAEPGYVTYNAPGDYVTKLTVTSANGVIDSSYRYVMIRDEVGRGGNPPVLKWELKSLSGSRDEGGYSAEFVVYDTFEIHDNSVVALVSNDMYGEQNVSFNGDQKSTEPYVFFVGYIEKGTIKFDYKKSRVEFTAVSPTGIMKDAIGFAVSVESKVSPSTWYELYDMDCRKAIYHYLRWHTTLLRICDFEFIGQDYKIQYFDSDRTSMFDAIDELMRTALVGSVCSNRQGKIFAEVHPKAYMNPTGTFVPVMDITRRDWRDEPSIEEAVNGESSYIEYGGIYYRGALENTFVPMLACAPGKTPSFRGEIEKEQGLALGSQAQLNTLVGHVWANKNSRFPTIEMEMSENLENLDIAPFETVRIRIEKEDTVRNVEIDGLYIPNSMRWEYDHENQILLPSIEFKSLVNGIPGDTIDIIEPKDDWGSPKFPSMNFTPVALVPFVTGTPQIIPDPQIVVLASPNYGILYTTNFNEVAPYWMTMNDGLAFPSGTYMSVGKIVVCPDESIWLMKKSTYSLTDPAFAISTDGYDEIWRCPFVGGTWEKKADSAQLGGYRFLDMTTNWTESSTVFVTAHKSEPQGNLGDRYDLRVYAVSTSGASLVFDVSDKIPWYHQPKGWGRKSIAYSDGSYFLAWHAFNGVLYRTNVYVVMQESGSVGEEENIYAWNNASSGNWFTECGKKSSKAVAWGTSDERLVVLPGSGYTPSSNISAFKPVQLPQAVSPSPSGKNVMGNNTWNIFTPHRSSDYGITWESMADVIPAGMNVWENCGSELQWIFGGGTNVKYTRNFGTDYKYGDANFNKEGNLSPSFPLIRIVGIRKVR